MNIKPIIIWFRNDLRTSDNAAINKAIEQGAPIIPLFIFDEEIMGEWKYGAAQKYWLHHSLKSLGNDLQQKGANLILRRGNTIANLGDIAIKSGASAIYCLRNYEPWASQLEDFINIHFKGSNVEFKRFSGNLLLEPEKLKNKSGNNFQVFTPFFRALQSSNMVRIPLPAPSKIMGFEEIKIESDDLNSWNLLPQKPNWAINFTNKIGEKHAQDKFEDFLKRIDKYSNGRDFPSLNSTSFLSPHLRFGEISPAQIWHKIYEISGNAPYGDYQKFLSELGWREFSYHILMQYPEMPNKPIKQQFENFPWENNELALLNWQKGQTGYPIIDAGMRELWQTGYMHNRVRMIVASFLIKHLMLPWQKGEKWFWDCLLDGDLANNAASWQWVAGCGMDAAPYFRIFNPITQGQKFDANGEYVRMWIPELARIPDEFIHFPKDAPIEVLSKAGVVLGRDYPMPIIDHKFARERALAGLKEISNKD